MIKFNNKFYVRGCAIKEIDCICCRDNASPPSFFNKEAIFYVKMLKFFRFGIFSLEVLENSFVEERKWLMDCKLHSYLPSCNGQSSKGFKFKFPWFLEAAYFFDNPTPIPVT